MNKTEAKQVMEELTMVLMFLSRFAERGNFSEAKDFYAWKGYDFDIINKLWDEDYIRQGNHPSRMKKVYITESGKEYARELMEKYSISDWEEQ